MKRVLSIITAVLALSILCSVSAFADSGNTKKDTMDIPGSGKNTKICALAKVYGNRNYSAFKVYSDTSTINKMDVWVQTTAGAWMSEKHRVYPDNNPYTIYYYSDQTFVEGKNVVFWGEQSNVVTKKIHYKAASH